MTTKHMAKLTRWAARVLAVLFIIFVSLFALDVFSEKDWFLALIMHLMPTFVLIFFTFIAWKNDIVGGVAFILLAVAFMAISRFTPEGAIIYMPAIVIGLLFLLGGWLNGPKL